MEAITPDAVRRQLLALEPLTHRLPPGADQAAVEELIAPAYSEVGASGAIYHRDLVLDVVTQRYATGVDPDDSAWAVDDFAVRQLADGVWLATYLLLQGERRSRRSTVWERTPDGWRALYHQGTLTQS